MGVWHANGAFDLGFGLCREHRRVLLQLKLSERRRMERRGDPTAAAGALLLWLYRRVPAGPGRLWPARTELGATRPRAHPSRARVSAADPDFPASRLRRPLPGPGL